MQGNTKTIIQISNVRNLTIAGWFCVFPPTPKADLSYHLSSKFV